MAELKKYSPLVIITLISISMWYLVAHDIVPPIIWSWQDFTDPKYYENLRKDWHAKPSIFLLRKLDSIADMRFGIAAGTLAERKEQRAIPILIRKVKSNYIDNGIHSSACGALATLSPETAKKVLMDVVEKYENVRKRNSSYQTKYKNALRMLAYMKDERVYPLCLEMAKSDDFREREFALDGALYYFDNHGEELLPLYIDYLNSKESFKGQVIKEIRGLKRPEAMPVLEKFASQDKYYAKDAKEAIEYLKSLQKQ